MKLQTKVQVHHYIAYVVYRLKCDQKALVRGREYRNKHLMTFRQWFVINYGRPV